MMMIAKICNLIFQRKNKNNKKEGNKVEHMENNENNVSKKTTEGLEGFIPKEIEEVLTTQVSVKTVEFLNAWAKLTRKSLQANKEIIFNCLTMDIEDGHVLCRFCAEGIPNWKADNAREHSSECPINQISEVLAEVKKMYRMVSNEASLETSNK